MKDHMTGSRSQALLAPSDIAKLGDVSAAAVSNWRKRSADFPQPAGGTDTRPLFARDDILDWMRANNKPILGLATSNAIAAMNLVREIRFGSSSADAGMDEAAHLIISLLAARKLSDEDSSAMPLWQNFLGQAGAEGFVALRELGTNYGIDRWDDLVVLPSYVDQIPPVAVEQIARLIDDVPTKDMAAAADAVLSRAVGAMGRAGSEHGYIGSRVSDFLVRISAHDAEGLVYDPACGIGDVLAQLSDLDAVASEPRIRWMVAHDINEQSVVLADQRGFFRNAPLELNTVDVLAKEPAPELKADLIVTEPPYGMNYEGYDLLDRRWTYGTPAKSSSELAWIQHAIAHLADGGVAYVVTSGGPLFRGGRDGDIRRGLVADGCVHAIYQLPAKLLQHTSIPVAVWVLGRPGTSDTVRFVNAEAFGVARGGRMELQSFSGRGEFEAANPSADVSITDVLAGDASLSPARWIGLDTVDPSTVADDYAAALERVHAAGEASVTVPVGQFVMSGPARVMTVGDLAAHGALSVQSGRSRVQTGDGGHPARVTVGDVRRGRLPVPNHVLQEQADIHETKAPEVLTEPGDVLVATFGQLAAMVDEVGGYSLDTGVVRIRVEGDQLQPEYLAAVIGGRWNHRFLTGQTVRRVPIKDLEIPVLPLAEQSSFARAAAELRRVQSVAAELQAAAASALDSLAELARHGDAAKPELSSAASD